MCVYAAYAPAAVQFGGLGHRDVALVLNLSEAMYASDVDEDFRKKID